MAPMHHARNDDVIHVAKNFLERLSFLGGAIRQLGADRAGLIVRRHSQSFDVFAKIRNPVREFMQLFAEFLRWRVTERLLLPILHVFLSLTPRFSGVASAERTLPKQIASAASLQNAKPKLKWNAPKSSNSCGSGFTP